jgi:hypothetical protein
MLNPLINLVSVLTTDSTLAGLMGTTVPNTLIYVGDVDIVQETQQSLQYPMLLIHTISDTFRVLPLNARDMHIQIDIMDRTSEMEAIQIYEQVCNDLAFVNTTQGGTRIWWTRPDSGADHSESEMRIYHIILDCIIYYYDNTPE